MVIVKDRSTTGNWYVYHRSLNSGEHLKLNSTAEVSTDSNYEIGKTTASATQFSIDTGSEIDETEEQSNESGGVIVDVDAVIRPGSLVSGNVRFSDGVSLGWQLTSTGQLGLIPGDDPEYRPSNEDLQDFQTQLQEVLKEKGF